MADLLDQCIHNLTAQGVLRIKVMLLRIREAFDHREEVNISGLDEQAVFQDELHNIFGNGTTFDFG